MSDITAQCGCGGGRPDKRIEARRKQIYASSWQEQQTTDHRTRSVLRYCPEWLAKFMRPD